jgi:hypothetical protein
MSFTPDSEVRVKELEGSDRELLRILEYTAPEAPSGSAAEILHLAGPFHRVRRWSNTGDSPTRMT